MRPCRSAMASIPRRTAWSVSRVRPCRRVSSSAACARTMPSHEVPVQRFAVFQRSFTRSLMLPPTGSASGSGAAAGAESGRSGCSEPCAGPVCWVLIQNASYSVMRSRALDSTARPRTRLITARRSSRPSGTRALHQASPLVLPSVTRSPSCTERSRNEATAWRVSSVRTGVMRRSSTMTANARPVFRAAASFVATAEGSPASSGSPATNDSNFAISWARPSSVSTKSSRVRPGTGRPCASSTTASIVITSTPDGKEGGAGSWRAPAAGSTREAPGAPPRERRAMKGTAVLAIIRVSRRRPYHEVSRPPSFRLLPRRRSMYDLHR